MDFPIHLLPKRTRAAIEAQISLGDYRVEATATAALAIMSLATQGLYNIIDPTRQNSKTHSLSQFFMVLMESGDAKSSVYGDLMKGPEEWTNQQTPAYNKRFKEWRSDVDIYKNALKKKSLGDGLDGLDEPTKPREPRNIASKVTTNAIFARLSEGWPSQGLFSDEAGTLLSSHSARTENSPVEFFGTLTSLWDKGQASRQTADISQYFENRRVSMLLMSQPATARIFLQNELLKEQGIHGRIHIVKSPKWAPPVARNYLDPKVAETAQPNLSKVRAFNERILDLLNRPLDMDEDGGLSFKVIGWTAAAAAKSPEIANLCIEARNKSKETYWQRLWEHVCRMAGVLAAFESNDPEINIEILDAAWAIIQYYANQWEELDLDVGNEKDSSLAPYQEKILKALKKAPDGLTMRDLARSTLSRVNLDVREKALKDLHADGEIEIIEIKSGTQTIRKYKLL